MEHITGNILSPNKDDDIAIIIVNPVSDNGHMNENIRCQIQQHQPYVNDLYLAKCELIRAGIGRMGDIQTIWSYFKNGYILINAFVFTGPNGTILDEIALKESLSHLRQGYAHDVFRIPYKLGYENTMTNEQWLTAFKIITHELVNKGVNVEIWHNVN